MDNDLALTGVYEVDVNNLIAMLSKVRNSLKACSDTSAANQNFTQLWHAVNVLHNDLLMVTANLKAHEKADDVIHTEQNERIEGLEQLVHGLTVDQVKALKEAAGLICEKARQTTLTLVNTDTGERTSLMTVGREHVESLKECIDY